MALAKAPGPARSRFRLLHGTTEIDLARGLHVMGRDPTCSIVLDDLRASRRHAQIRVDESGCVISDLGSANGTFVNGEQLTKPRGLTGGDWITVAQQELQVVDTRGSGVGAAQRPARDPGDDPRSTPPTGVRLAGSARPVAQDGGPATPRPLTPRPAVAPKRPHADMARGDLLADEATLVTSQVDTFQLYGRLADQALSVQDDTGAAQILTAQFRGIVAEGKRRGSVPPEALDFMARYVVRLVLVTRDAGWLDAAFRVFTVARRPLPSPTIQEIQGALRRMPPFDRAALRDYVEALRAASDTLSASERFSIAHLAGLEQALGRAPG